MMNQYVKDILEVQQKANVAAQEECNTTYGPIVFNESASPYYDNITKSQICAPYWDTILCWPPTPAGSMATRNCPSYVTGSLPMNNATRQCEENGHWFRVQNVSWTNYTSCFESDYAQIWVDIDKFDVSNFSQRYFPAVKIISQTGYAVSLGTLMIAFVIMLCNKKLHCTRNILHMHLFASFMLRAFIFLLKDLAFVDGIGLPKDLIYQNGSVYFNVDSESNNWCCKLFTSLWQYFMTANYSWILMEGLYLHNLIFRALFADSNNNIRWYVIYGWGLPLIIISKWVIVRLLVEDTFCWTTHDNYKVFLIIAIPTFASILINFVFFTRISMVLYSKLRSPVNEDSRRYQKWVKSTLVLVPLFGVHYAISLILFYPIKTNKVLEMIWFFFDRLFGSFQGFFVAVLYCFLNGEVKAEIKPRLQDFLTAMATNKYSKHFFPCRKKYLRSIAGRTSVCTTMSCSSLYTNGIMHRNSKCRIDCTSKRHSGQVDKFKDHVCHTTRSLQEIPSRRDSKSHRLNGISDQRHSQPLNFPGVIMTTETCLNSKDLDGEVSEESVKMVTNNF